MLKTPTVFLLSLIFVSSSCFAQTIRIYDDAVYVLRWEEIKYIQDKDLIVHAKIPIRVSSLILDKSNNFTIDFYPTEPGQTKDVEYFKVRIFKDCTQVDIRYLMEPVINCDKELIENKDFFVKEKENYIWSETREITVMLSKIKHWKNYNLLIEYKLPDFVKKKGHIYYFSYDKYCQDHEKNKNNCPSSEGIDVQEATIILNENALWSNYPENGKAHYLLNEYPILNLYGYGPSYSQSPIEYIDTEETEKWIPFKWAFFGAIIAFVLEKIGGTLWVCIKPHLKRKKKSVLLKIYKKLRKT